MRQVPPGARVSPQGVPPALWAPPLPRRSGRAPGCARCGRGPLGVSPRVRRGGRPLGRAVLPTLLGVPASKVLGVGRTPFWGRSDPCRGHRAGEWRGSRSGKPPQDVRGTWGRPCVPARRPGPDAGWAAPPVKVAAEARVSARSTATPCGWEGVGCGAPTAQPFRGVT